MLNCVLIITKETKRLLKLKDDVNQIFFSKNINIQFRLTRNVETAYKLMGDYHLRFLYVIKDQVKDAEEFLQEVQALRQQYPLAMYVGIWDIAVSKADVQYIQKKKEDKEPILIINEKRLIPHFIKQLSIYDSWIKKLEHLEQEKAELKK